MSCKWNEYRKCGAPNWNVSRKWAPGAIQAHSSGWIRNRIWPRTYLPNLFKEKNHTLGILKMKPKIYQSLLTTTRTLQNTIHTYSKPRDSSRRYYTSQREPNRNSWTWHLAQPWNIRDGRLQPVYLGFSSKRRELIVTPRHHKEKIRTNSHHVVFMAEIYVARTRRKSSRRCQIGFLCEFGAPKSVEGREELNRIFSSFGKYTGGLFPPRTNSGSQTPHTGQLKNVALNKYISLQGF